MLDVGRIILHLTRLLNDEKTDRSESAKNLTPIEIVHESGSITSFPNTITVTKYSHQTRELIPVFSDLLTEILDEELFKHFKTMENETFRLALNKALFDFIVVKSEEEKKLGVWDKESIYYYPLKEFLFWLDDNGINHKKLPSFTQFIKKDETNDALWAIADDLRYRKKNGEFETYRDAYRWAEKNISKKGVNITAMRLERAYHKARFEGRI